MFFKQAITALTMTLAIGLSQAVAATAGKVGVVGYCWGGLLAWLAGARIPGFACAISYYGGGMHKELRPRAK